MLDNGLAEFLKSCLKQVLLGVLKVLEQYDKAHHLEKSTVECVFACDVMDAGGF